MVSLLRYYKLSAVHLQSDQAIMCIIKSPCNTLLKLWLPFADIMFV